MNKIFAGSGLLLLLTTACSSTHKPPSYYVGKQQVQPALQWCQVTPSGKRTELCFASVDPVIGGQPVEEKRFVVPLERLEVRHE
jgi:hypothetical protein